MLIYQTYERREFQLQNELLNVYIDRVEHLLWRVKILGRYEKFEKKNKLKKKKKNRLENE